MHDSCVKVLGIENIPQNHIKFVLFLFLTLLCKLYIEENKCLEPIPLRLPPYQICNCCFNFSFLKNPFVRIHFRNLELFNTAWPVSNSHVDETTLNPHISTTNHQRTSKYVGILSGNSESHISAIIIVKCCSSRVYIHEYVLIENILLHNLNKHYS